MPNMRTLAALALLVAAVAPQSAHAVCKSHFDDPVPTTPINQGGKPGQQGTPAPKPVTASPVQTPAPKPVTASPVQTPAPSKGAATPVPTPSHTKGNGSSGGNGSIGQDNDTVTLPGQFKPVTSIQVRVQGNLPSWNEANQIFITSFGSTFEAKYTGVADTVNMAAVEGAFKYVQAECINQDVVVNCTRKNSIKYIAFYETTIVQPKAAMAYYGGDTSGKAAIEHCPFIPMDGGQCTPTNGVFPKECDQYTGVNGQPKLGFCVGGTLQDSDYLAPYPNNYWFSYPNSCPREVWAKKNAACRSEQAGGLCPFGVQPDGVKCTFSYKILGYIGLDDVVGITSMTNPSTGKTYADYGEFCRAGGVEYDVLTTGGKLTVNQTIPFWSEPADRTRNEQRVEVLVEKYNKLVSTNPKTADGGIMQPLPSIASLKARNPPCYENSVQCAKAPFGCRRALYSQICEVCPSKAADCVVKPTNAVYP